MKVERLTSDATLPLNFVVQVDTGEELADLYTRMFWEPPFTSPEFPDFDRYGSTDELYEMIRDFVTEFQAELH